MAHNDIVLIKKVGSSSVLNSDSIFKDEEISHRLLSNDRYWSV
jgi:hypothetical protein